MSVTNLLRLESPRGAPKVCAEGKILKIGGARSPENAFPSRNTT